MSLRRGLWLGVTLLLACCSLLPQEEPAYPTTRKSDTVDDYHGVRIADPYRWLEAVEDPEVRAWTASQNRLAEQHLNRLPLRQHFADRVAALGQALETRRVRRQAGRWIISHVQADGSTDFYVQDSIDGPPRLLLSSSERFPDRKETVRNVYPSPDGSTLAYTAATDGSISLTLRFHDLERGADLDEMIVDTKWGHPQWTADSRSILYQRLLKPGHTQEDGIDRESAIWRHELGTDTSEDEILYRVNPDELGAGASVTLPPPGRYALISDSYAGENLIAVLDLGDPMKPAFDGPVVEVTPGRSGSNRAIGMVGSTVYLLTTRDAPQGRIVAVDLDAPTEWRTIVPEGEHLLERAMLAGDRICVGFMRDVTSHLEVYDLEGERVGEVPLPARGSAFAFSGDASSPTMSFAFDSFTHPLATWTLDTTTLAVTPLSGQAPAVDQADYLTEQVFFTSRDGTRVPMFLVARTDHEGGPRPTILYGYGAAGAVYGPLYSPEWLAWVEAGGIFALANVRGGGEYGEAWARAGQREHKQNTYDDFIAAAEYLISEGHTTREQLAIQGASNGGMLVGAVMTQRPDLFAAAVPISGVLDALRFPSFTAGPRWAQGLGDPSIEEEFGWLIAWSPLHHIEDGVSYPATLVVTAADDDVVHPSQSYKFAARLQEAQGGDAPVLLRVYETGAHRILESSAAQPHWAADRLAFTARHTGLALR